MQLFRHSKLQCSGCHTPANKASASDIRRKHPGNKQRMPTCSSSPPSATSTRSMRLSMTTNSLRQSFHTSNPPHCKIRKTSRIMFVWVPALVNTVANTHSLPASSFPLFFTFTLN